MLLAEWVLNMEHIAWGDFHCPSWESFLYYSVLILLVQEWTLSEPVVVTGMGRCLLFLPAQQISSFGALHCPSLQWSVGRQLVNNHVVQWLVIVTTMVIDCPVVFQAYLGMSLGKKKTIQLRVANLVLLVRNNGSFFAPGWNSLWKAVVTELNMSPHAVFFRKVSELKASVRGRPLNSIQKTTFSKKWGWRRVLVIFRCCGVFLPTKPKIKFELVKAFFGVFRRGHLESVEYHLHTNFTLCSVHILSLNGILWRGSRDSRSFNL